MSVFLSALESCSVLCQNICDGLVCFIVNLSNISLVTADPDGRAVQGVRLRQLACWDCGLELRRRHRCFSFVSVVFCEVSATGRSLDRRSHTDCGVSECDIETSNIRRLRPTRFVEPLKNI